MYIGRRNVEGGGRQQTFANNSFRTVAGVRGAINEAWGYDVSAQYSSVGVNTGTRTTSSTTGWSARARRHRRRRRADLPLGDRRLGSACVPWNPFQPNRRERRPSSNYLQADGLQIGRISQEIYNGVINGDLGAYGIKSPLASDGIQVVFGAEYRRDALRQLRRRAAGAATSSPAAAVP